MSAGWSCNEWDQLEEVIVGEAQAPTAVCSKKFYDNESTGLLITAGKIVLSYMTMKSKLRSLLVDC